MRLSGFGPLVAAAAGLAAGPALGQSCTVSATAAAFGVYNPLSPTPTDTTATVTLTCLSSLTTTLPYGVALSTGVSGTYSGRQLNSGAATLTYQLYRDPAHTQIWGDGSGGSSVTSGVAPLVTNISYSTTLTAYGRISAAQNVGAGSYVDLIVTTVTW